MSEPKEVEVKTRVTVKMKADLTSAADARNESVSLILREAISEYLMKREKVTEAPAVADTPLPPGANKKKSGVLLAGTVHAASSLLPAVAVNL